MKKIYIGPLYAFLILWLINIFTNNAILHHAEKITLATFGLLLGVQVIQEAKKSNERKEAYSGLIKQLTFICPPNLKSDIPFKKVEVLGYIEIIICIILLTSEITEMFI